MLTRSEDEERRLLLAPPPYLREMILFAINTGLRTNEIFNLAWAVPRRFRKRFRSRVGSRPSGFSSRSSLSVFVLYQRPPKHGRYVFHNPMTGDRFKDVKGALLATVKRAGLPNVTWHMFRHTFASRLTRSGVDIVTVKELLGHANISVPMRYAHSNDETKRRAVERLGTCDKIVPVVPRRARVAV